MKAPAFPESRFVNHVGFVQGSIAGGGPYWFLVDTGANRSAVDSAVAEELGLELGEATSVEGAGATFEVESAHLPELTIGDLAFHGLNPTLQDLSGSLAPPGETIAGIVGFDVLQGLAVQFDLGGDRVGLAASAADFALGEPLFEAPFALDNDIPLIEAEIDGEPFQLRLDTGASLPEMEQPFLNLTQSELARLVADKPGWQPAMSFSIGSGDTAVTIPVYEAGQLAIGGYTFARPHLIVQPPAGYFARPGAHGFVANYTFGSDAIVVVDYPAGTIAFYGNAPSP